MEQQTAKVAEVNPWRALPKGPIYLLPEDQLAVEVFNSSADPRHKIHVKSPPEPFLGHPDAPIVVLLLNPGTNANGIYDHRLLDELRGDSPAPTHFYIGAGNRWWDKLVRSLARDRPDADVASALLSIEYFPYRSDSFGCGHVRLPSQAYTFQLVERAIDRGAAIVIARGERYWFGAVPRLAAYANRVRIRNPRMASLSLANLHDDGYEKLLVGLDAHSPPG